MIGDPRTITEKQFQQAVLELFSVYHWRTYHNPDSRRSTAGFPDLVCVHPKLGVVFLELKREKGRISPAQIEWRDDLNATALTAKHRAYILRPSQWGALTLIARYGPVEERTGQ